VTPQVPTDMIYLSISMLISHVNLATYVLSLRTGGHIQLTTPHDTPRDSY
jgi:hypothetical protein